MTRRNSTGLWYQSRMGAVALVLALAGCGGGSTGSQGPAGPPGPGGPPGAQPPSATSLIMTITSASIASPPVVNFTVTNEGGFAYPGLKSTDLRFNIAKLNPGTNGNPSTWQDYIVRASGGVLQGSQERDSSGYLWGSLVDHNDGTYTYTFASDITAPAFPGTCPVNPCETPDGKTVDLSYNPALLTRVGIQMSNSALPLVNKTYDFIPSTGANEVDNAQAIADADRIIVNTDNCNQCHSQLKAHGTRIDTKLCVTCHNPGTWANSTTPVDFKVMIHKIHRSPNLGTNSAPVYLPHNDYAVGSSDFSDVEFPQDTRNCTKCHHDSNTSSQGASPQGDNWETAPNMAACGSCHDDVDFSTGANHQGGIRTNAECLGCHQTGGWAGSIAQSHTIPEMVARANFEFRIWKICGTDVDKAPMCAPGRNPTVTFSVCDPDANSPAHQYSASLMPDSKTRNCYNILSTSTDKEFTSSATRLAMDFAWNTTDYNNDGGSGGAPSQATSVDLPSSSAVYNGDGTFTVDGSVEGVTIPAAATGTGAVGLEGHPATDDGSGTYPLEVPADSKVAYFGITDSTPKPRREVVDAATRCDNCHGVLSLHGANRNNNTQLCVFCHNPNGTDVSQRPLNANNLPDNTATLDGKTEESIDFKRLIHSIHAGSAANGGFRTNGLVVYGYGGRATDFSDVRFPGILSKCDTCHVQESKKISNSTYTFDSYTLEDRSIVGGANWEYPSQNGILGSTVDSYPLAAADGSDFSAQLANHADDLKWSPIAAACSACHDDTLARSHMMSNRALIGDNVLQPVDPVTGRTDGSTELTLTGNVESCPACHGPGALADVKAVHN
jgi:OmcA/MtrC family decaheme c-type cytochrome